MTMIAIEHATATQHMTRSLHDQLLCCPRQTQRLSHAEHSMRHCQQRQDTRQTDLHNTNVHLPVRLSHIHQGAHIHQVSHGTLEGDNLWLVGIIPLQPRPVREALQAVIMAHVWPVPVMANKSPELKLSACLCCTTVCAIRTHVNLFRVDDLDVEFTETCQDPATWAPPWLLIVLQDTRWARQGAGSTLQLDCSPCLCPSIAC